MDCREKNSDRGGETSETSSGNQSKSSENVLRPSYVAKIKEFLENRGFTAVTLNISPGTRKGDNYCGTLAEIKIQARDRDGNPRFLRWISKSAPVEEAQRQIIKADMLYQKEITAYEKIFPILRQFQNQHGAPSPFKEYPKYILSYAEEDQENFVMEDMKQLGFLMEDKRNPLDYHHVILVLETYAKLHSVSYAMKDRFPEEFEALKELAKDTYFCKQDYPAEVIKRYEENYRQGMLGCLNSERDARIMEELKLFLETPISIVMRAIAEQNEHSVLIHGDNWINNLLFKYGDPNNLTIPTEVCLLDFQLTRIGSPAFDITYFIYSCTDKRFRRKYFDDVIKRYHSTLQRCIRDLGSDPSRLLPFNILEEEIRRFSIVGFYMSTIILKFMVEPRRETPEWSKAQNVEGLLEALDYERHVDMVCKERIRDVIVDFVDKGCLDFLNCKR